MAPIIRYPKAEFVDEISNSQYVVYIVEIGYRARNKWRSLWFSILDGIHIYNLPHEVWKLVRSMRDQTGIRKSG